MYYTIASVRNYGGTFQMELNQNGQGYNIRISQYEDDGEGVSTGELKNHAKKDYPRADRQEAQDAFLRLTACILDGTYSFEQRAEML